MRNGAGGWVDSLMLVTRTLDSASKLGTDRVSELLTPGYSESSVVTISDATGTWRTKVVSCLSAAQWVVARIWQSELHTIGGAKRFASSHPKVEFQYTGPTSSRALSPGYVWSVDNAKGLRFAAFRFYLLGVNRNKALAEQLVYVFSNENKRKFDSKRVLVIQALEANLRALSLGKNRTAAASWGAIRAQLLRLVSVNPKSDLDSRNGVSLTVNDVVRHLDTWSLLFDTHALSWGLVSNGKASPLLQSERQLLVNSSKLFDMAFSGGKKFAYSANSG